METLSSLPATLQIALVLLLVMIIWAVFKKMMKFALIAAFIVLVIVGLWSMLSS